MRKKLLILLCCIITPTFADMVPVSIPSTLKNNVSFTVLNAKSGSMIASYNATTPRLVASNMKLLTTWIALDKLHSDFTWQTKLYYYGTVKKGVLTGQVYVKGGGDPTFSRDDLYSLLSNLKKVGIKKINGDIVVDENIFNTLPTYSMLKPEKYDSDTVVPHGFMVDGDIAKFTLNIQKDTVDFDSNLNENLVINKLVVNHKLSNCDNLYSRVIVSKSNDQVVLNGSVPPQCDGRTIEYNLYTHEAYLDQVFSNVMEQLNIDYDQLDDVNVKNSMPLHAKLIVSHTSKPLSDVLYEMNHFSVNLFAETILLTIGAYTTKNDDTYNDAKKVYYIFMDDHDLKNPKFKLENGAGLSRTEYLTTDTLAQILFSIQHSKYDVEFEKTLPSPNGSGTLESKFTEFGSRLICKTGTLNDVKSYAGYFYNKSGQKFIIVFTVNGLERNSNKFNIFDQYVTDNFAYLDKLH